MATRDRRKSRRAGIYRAVLVVALLAGGSLAWNEGATASATPGSESAPSGVVTGTAWPCVGLANAADLRPVGVRVSRGDAVMRRFRAYAPRFRFEVRLVEGGYLFSTSALIQRHVHVVHGTVTTEDLNPGCK
jgi:hypothetical protein